MTMDEMERGLRLAAEVFTHHDRYGRDSVIVGEPDVFSIDIDNCQDIVVRLDGRYSLSESDIEAIVKHWARTVNGLTAFLRLHHEEIFSW